MISVNRQVLYETADNLHSLCTEILDIKLSVDTINLNDTFSEYKWDIMPYREILRKLKEDLVEELQGMLALQISLKDSADAYGKTEQDIMALQNGLDYSPKMLVQSYMENTKGLICFAPGYGIIEEKQKWYQSNEFKLLLSLAINTGLGIANIYCCGTLTPLLEASLALSAGTAVIGGAVESSSGGEFYDGFSDNALRATVGTIAFGGLNMQLGSVAFGTAKSAIVTKFIFNGATNDMLYSADSIYHEQDTTLKGHLAAFGIGGGIAALETWYLRDYRLLPKSAPGTITEYAGWNNNEGNDWTGIGTSGKGIPIDEVPSDVLNDIYSDEKAVFGYSPKEGTAYGNMDFTDTEKVLADREIRVSYINDSVKIQEKIDEMTVYGKSREEIANVVVDMRNQSKVLARSNMNAKDVATLEARNTAKYGNPIGPDAKWLFKENMKKAILSGRDVSEEDVWNQIISHSMKKDDVANTLLGIKHN